MNITDALKWADNFGPMQIYPPNGDSPALMALAAEVRRLRADRDCEKRLRKDIPVAIVDTRVTLGLCAPTEEDFPALYALQGRRVALVDLGPA